MDHYGNIALKGGSKILNMSLQGLTRFADNPQPGDVAFVNKRVWNCVEINGVLPVWVPMSQEIDIHEHIQQVSQLEWTITHGLNCSRVLAQVFDENGMVVWPDEIDQSLFNVVTIRFGVPFKGSAMLQRGTSFGLPKENVAFVQNYIGLSSWAVPHNLGYNPTITCIVDNNVVQPADIVFNSTNLATVTFSSPTTGYVRCV